ncbi:MAG: hypothetical protein HRU06_06865 [Oceanospirillaceae bacterium]|nr:hypothetical protein [Oceanospirillaceae bacterium]
MSGYIIHHYNITDQSRIDQLGPLSLPIVEKYAGQLLVASRVQVLARILHPTARVLACSLFLQAFLSQSTGHTSTAFNRKKACKNN